MQFLISVLDTASNTATSDEMEAIRAFNRRLDAGGHRVLAVGLADPAETTVVDNRNDAGLRTDGPFAETKEFAAGLWIFEATDLQQALALADEGSKACNRRLELRALI